jgi:hypothetical protein
MYRPQLLLLALAISLIIYIMINSELLAFANIVVILAETFIAGVMAVVVGIAVAVMQFISWKSESVLCKLTKDLHVKEAVTRVNL